MKETKGIVLIIALKWIDAMENKKDLTEKEKKLIMEFARDVDVFISGGKYEEN